MINAQSNLLPPLIALFSVEIDDGFCCGSTELLPIGDMAIRLTVLTTTCENIPKLGRHSVRVDNRLICNGAFSVAGGNQSRRTAHMLVGLVTL